MIFFESKTTIYVLLGSSFAAAIVKRPPVRDNEQKNGQGVLMKRKEGPGNNSKAIDQEALADQIALHLDQMETFFLEHESPDLVWDIVSSADEADLGDASLVDSDHDTVSVHSEDLHYFETEMEEIEDSIEEHPDFRSLQTMDPVSIHGSPQCCELFVHHRIRGCTMVRKRRPIVSDIRKRRLIVSYFRLYQSTISYRVGEFFSAILSLRWV